MSEMLDAALSYASMGWRVLPLWPRTKDPATAHGFKDATTDEAQIRRWWKAHPDYNIGVATGNGLCVVDVDDKEKNAAFGSDMLRDWELEHGDISETVCCTTPTGGTHYYFDVGDTSIPSCASDTIFIDLRCENGFIVVPPSVHPDTMTRYVWDIAPDEMPPAGVTPIDKACIEWVYANRRGADKDGRPDTNLPEEKVHEGEGRNNFLFQQGRMVRGKGFSDDMVLDYLTTVNKGKCEPPLDSSELNKLVKSVCSVPPGPSDEVKKAMEKKSPNGKTRSGFDHAAIARKLMDEYGACFVDGMPAIRNGYRYEIGWNAISKEIIALDDHATKHQQHEVHHYITVMGEKKRQSEPELIAFRNGILDIRTMELREWQEGDIIPNIIPHDWNPEASCPEVDNVLKKMSCGDADVFGSLIECVGMCMYRSNEFTQSAILLGSGSNGKSTFIRMVQELLGRENISALDMSMLGKQFHTGLIAGKLANLGDDISNEFQRGELLATFKKVVDGNRLHTDVKGTDGYDFEPYCMLVFSANEFPRLADYTDGMIRRIFPIEFNARFSKSDPDYDPRISRKVTSEEACQRLAVMGIVGLERVRRNNGFTPTAASSKRVDEIRVDNDTVLAWLEELEYSVSKVDGRPVALLYNEYRNWCLDAGLQPVKRAKFTRGVNSSLGTEVAVSRIAGTPQRVFHSPE